MSKIKAVIAGVVLVVLTFVATMTFSLVVGNKVIVSKKDYNNLKSFQKVIQLRDAITTDFYQEVDQENLYDGIAKGVFEGLDDPYSQYYTKEEYATLMENTSGTYVGIGIVISPGDDGLITVVAPIEGSPAEKAGIKPGDKVTHVDGVVYEAKDMDKAISIIKGTPGETVSLTILRDNKPMNIDIVREQILIKSVKSEMMEDMGYIRISSFDENTGKEFGEHLATIKAQNPKGLIIDLRDNPGGLLDQVKVVADDVLGDATIVYVENRAGQRSYLKSDAKGKLDIPLIVLVNGNSASASEIFAGAIRDNKAGKLLGTTTFGKGLVQSVIELPDGTGYKLTTAQYYTPSGEYINKKGIVPDVVVEPSENEDEDPQLDKAIELLKEETQN